MKTMAGITRNLKISGKVEFTKNITIIIDPETNFETVDLTEPLARIIKSIESGYLGRTKIVLDEVKWDD